jgi:histidinol phosphatase-like enzyme (inositol monophosphatase family)
MSELLAAAAEVAGIAGRIALSHFRLNLAVERKRDGSPVTKADRAAERAARKWIAARYPRDAIVGEELGETPGSSGRRWLIDPIDGTASFVRRVPLWGSLVAVMEGDVVLAGAAAFPALGESIAAAPGKGCWHNGALARVSGICRLEDAAALITETGAFEEPAWEHGWRSLATRAATARTWGDCFGYLLVATGRAEAMIDPRVNTWDIACFVPIIREAGGHLTDLRGGTWPLAHAVATNAALGPVIRRALATGALS